MKKSEIFAKPIILTTNRIILRPKQLEDKESLIEILENVEVLKYEINIRDNHQKRFENDFKRMHKQMILKSDIVGRFSCKTNQKKQ